VFIRHNKLIIKNLLTYLCRERFNVVGSHGVDDRRDFDAGGTAPGRTVPTDMDVEGFRPVDRRRSTTSGDDHGRTGDAMPGSSPGRRRLLYW